MAFDAQLFVSKDALERPSPGSTTARHGPYMNPGDPITKADYRKMVETSGFAGNVVVGTDLARIRLIRK